MMFSYINVVNLHSFHLSLPGPPHTSAPFFSSGAQGLGGCGTQDRHSEQMGCSRINKATGSVLVEAGHNRSLHLPSFTLLLNNLSCCFDFALRRVSVPPKSMCVKLNPQ